MKTRETLITFFIYIVGLEPRGNLIHGKNVLPDLYWNTTNPIFLISNTDHIIDVNKATAIHEYDTINIVCPKYDKETEDERMERHVIYNVNKEEYDTCRILSDTPRIIGFCTEPTRERLFTISFRSFSPKPNSVEFERGKSYYFISTSSPGDLRTRQGGYCVHNNMKVVFKVAEKNSKNATSKTPFSDTRLNSPNENVVKSKAKAVVAKWKEEKAVEKKYLYNRQHDSSKRAKESNMIKESQSILDRQFIKDKMLSDEESRIFFYTTSKVMETNNNNNRKSSSVRVKAGTEERRLETFSSSAMPVTVSCILAITITTLMPFI